MELKLKAAKRKPQANVTSKPYSSVKIAFKYAQYCLTSKTYHNVHAPLVYGFCENVLINKNTPKSEAVEQERKKFKASSQTLTFIDYGKNGATVFKKVKNIATKSLKSPKYARLLARSVAYFKVENILELGTSLGITTAYLAKNKGVKVVSMEGDKSVASLAKKAWDKLGINNVTQVIGNFDDNLESVLSNKPFDFIYLDGNHKLEPTIQYFEQCIAHSSSKCVLVFDDIHYSKDMEQAWTAIKNHPKVLCTIDIFFLGYVFLNYEITPKHYVLRF